MDKWADEVVYNVVAICKSDPAYQQLKEECLAAEEKYTRIMEKLSEEERLQVDDYIALCEELQYRFSQLAYRYGVMENLTDNRR